MGKKSRNNKSSSSGNVGGGGCQYLDTVITAIKKYLDLAELQQLPMENYFPRHRHSVSSCDGDGAYNIYSLFVMSPSIFPPGSPEMGVITVVCMRVHDNIRNTLFLPSDSLPAVFPHLEGKSLDGCYTYLMEQNTKDAGNPYRSASFEVCKQLVNDCLLRMKAKKKVLVGKEERTVVRFFGLQSGDAFHKSGITLPRPAPAPSVEDIWLTLNRPEYYYFHVVGDLNDCFGTGYGEKRAITQGDFERAMTCIAEDEYRRERLLGMLYHMALWHMLEASEEVVSSWLLWERSGMMTSPVEHPDSTSVMKDSIVLQIVVNKYFDCGCGELIIPQFPELGEYGYGVSNYFFYSQHMELTGKMPPAFLITASVAKSVGGYNCSNAESDSINGEHALLNIERTIRGLRIKKTSCGICGATRATNGNKLLLCSRCKSVAYCCVNHQKLDWKSGGHKQQCSVSDD